MLLTYHHRHVRTKATIAIQISSYRHQFSVFSYSSLIHANNDKQLHYMIEKRDSMAKLLHSSGCSSNFTAYLMYSNSTLYFVRYDHRFHIGAYISYLVLHEIRVSASRYHSILITIQHTSHWTLEPARTCTTQKFVHTLKHLNIS